MGKGGCNNDAVNEEKIILCCALGCFNCGWYNACDACGVSGKVMKTTTRVVPSIPFVAVFSLLILFTAFVGWNLLLQLGVLLQAWRSLPFSAVLLGS
jgi:hypothetical protein